MALTQRDEEIRDAARAGKKKFIVTRVVEERNYVWASDSAKAEEELYWQTSSGRPYPGVERIDRQVSYRVELVG